MPEYEYECIEGPEQGQRVMLWFKHDDPEKGEMGETIEHEGMKLRRLLPGNVHGNSGGVGFKKFRSHQFSEDDPRITKRDADGAAVFETKEDVQQVIGEDARHNDGTGKRLAWQG